MILVSLPDIVIQYESKAVSISLVREYSEKSENILSALRFSYLHWI